MWWNLFADWIKPVGVPNAKNCSGHPDEPEKEEEEKKSQENYLEPKGKVWGTGVSKKIGKNERGWKRDNLIDTKNGTLVDKSAGIMEETSQVRSPFLKSAYGLF